MNRTLLVSMALLLAGCVVQPPPMQVELPPPPRVAPPGCLPLAPCPSGALAEDTRVAPAGAITAVDVGAETKDLREALAHQIAAAAPRGETVLLMTTSANCAPCRGVDASLSDRRMQEALAHVRLVRVDVDRFGDDLARLNIPARQIPGFFLLGPDLQPVDGILGSEWGDDVPANMAPVLGPFVRGRLRKRAHPWEAPPP